MNLLKRSQWGHWLFLFFSSKESATTLTNEGYGATKDGLECEARTQGKWNIFSHKWESFGSQGDFFSRLSRWIPKLNHSN